MDTHSKFFALNLTKRIQIMLSLAVGIIMLWFGISDNKHQLDLFTVLTFAEIPLTCTMVIFLLELMRIKDNCNYGTLELVSQLKIFLGMRVFHLRKLAKFMALNSKRTLVTLSSLEEVAPTRSKFLTVTICSSLALKLRT